MEILSGKKTYLVSVGIVLAAIGSFLAGDMSLQEAMVFILNGLGLGTLRAGVAKGAKK